MPRKGSGRPWPELGEAPRGLTARMRQHYAWLTTQYTASTLEGRAKTLRQFLDWCAERDIRFPEELTLPVLERYQRFLFQARQKNGHPLSASTQAGQLNAVRQFFHWLMRHHYILSNPAAELVIPKIPQRLPRHVLTLAEVERVLAQPEITTGLGLRDRAMLEVLYTSGIRRSELVKLEVTDLQMGQGTLFIREGKGRKDRIVPVGERAMRWVAKYLAEVRPRLVQGRDDARWLFVSEQGTALCPDRVTHRLGQYIKAADLGKAGACHLLRHSMATSMLENGADVRFIQELLGHADLRATQIYTRVSIHKLRAVHAATHPASDDRRAVQESEPVLAAPEDAEVQGLRRYKTRRSVTPAANSVDE